MPRLKQLVSLAATLCVGGWLGAIFGAIVVLAYGVDFNSTISSARGSAFEVLVAFASLSFLISVVSVPASLAIGIPAFYVLRKVGLLNWWAFTALGAQSALLISFPDRSFGVLFAIEVGIGAASALIAWLYIARSSFAGLTRNVAPSP
jgi:hypothetical protein